MARLDSRDAARWNAQGVFEISPREGIAALERLLKDGSVQAAVLKVDWRKYCGDSRPRPALLRNIVLAKQGAAEKSVVAHHGSFRSELAGAPESQRRSLLSRHVRARALAVLGLDGARVIDERQPLQEMGLDSLMAVELRNTLAAQFEVSLPSTLAIDHPSVEALSAFIFDKLFGTQTAAKTRTADDAAAIETGRRATAVAEVAQLSEEEAELLLLRELETHGDGQRHE